MSTCGLAPLAEMFNLAVCATADNGVIALQLQSSVAVVNDMGFAVEALAGIVAGGQFKEADVIHGITSYYYGLLPFDYDTIIADCTRLSIPKLIFFLYYFYINIYILSVYIARGENLEST